MRWLALWACLAGCAVEGAIRGDCRDEVDNDGDGAIDCDDPSCSQTRRCQLDTAFDSDDRRDTGSAFPTITYGWSGEALTVAVFNRTGGFDLGIAETASESGGWFGEDCFNGSAGFNLCHPFDGSRGTLRSLGDGADPGDPDDVLPGATTLFNVDLAFDDERVDRLTYMVTFDGGACATWGHETRYYEPFGCLALRIDPEF